MDFTKVVIYVSSKGIEALTNRLIMIGVNGFEIEDFADFEDFLNSKPLYFDYVDEDLLKQKQTESNVKIYVHNDSQGGELLKNIKKEVQILKKQDALCEYGRLDICLNTVKQQNWDQNWKKYFKPFTVGERFVVKPSWESYNNDTNRIILEIDPASSFGTGSHYTTRLCLEALERSGCAGKKILDMGCGSGILSIAALLLGGDCVLAVDIEENSTKTTLDNAVKNNISKERLSVLTGNIITDNMLREKILKNKYDIIVANIVADVIIDMGVYFKDFLKKDGLLIVSGIIDERSCEVWAALERVGFKTEKITSMGGWTQIDLRKKG